MHGSRNRRHIPSPNAHFDERQRLVWKRLEEIKIGDYLAVQRGAGVYGNRIDIGRTAPTLPDTMTPDLAEWLGMIVAGGHGGHEGWRNYLPQKILKSWIASLN